MSFLWVDHKNNDSDHDDDKYKKLEDRVDKLEDKVDKLEGNNNDEGIGRDIRDQSATEKMKHR